MGLSTLTANAGGHLSSFGCFRCAESSEATERDFSLESLHLYTKRHWHVPVNKEDLLDGLLQKLAGEAPEQHLILLGYRAAVQVFDEPRMIPYLQIILVIKEVDFALNKRGFPQHSRDQHSTVRIHIYGLTVILRPKKQFLHIPIM